MILPVYLGTQEAYNGKRIYETLILGGYLGMMLFLLLYNIFIFASTGYRSYLNYVIYIALVTLTQVHFMGLAKLYFWPTNMWLAGAASMILTVLTAIAANEFLKRFTEAKRQIPKMVAVSHIFYILLVIELIMATSNTGKLGYELMQPTVGGFALYQLTMSIVLVLKGNRQAKFFLLAWAVFLLGIVIFILKDLSVLPFTLYTQNTMVFGSAIEGILLSFGLADHIKVLRRDKQRSQENALRIAKENERIIREQNALLEEKVHERTADLEKSNKDLKSAQSKLVDAEKMASLGQLTAGIAHEINNPLNFISTNIPPLKRDLSEIIDVYRSQADLVARSDDPMAEAIRQKAVELDIEYTLKEVNEIVESISEGASRTTEIVRGLRDFSRLDQDGMKPADINQGINSTLILLDPDLRKNVEIITDLQGTDVIDCFPGKLNQVFMNLMNNALQAIYERYTGEPGGVLTVRTFSDELSYVVQIADNANGMDQETKSKIFEPFFTTKDVGEGVGLGLSITHGIIENHNGTIDVKSEVGVGTEFSITIPRPAQPIKKSA
jgi:signal transduction histidine kinase